MIQTQQYLYFINSIASEATKKVYTHALQKFCNYVKADDCIRLLGIHQSLIEAQIIDYIVQLKNRGLSFQCINVHLAAIFHFYEMNDVILNRKKIKRFIGKRSVKKEEMGKAYNREDIAKMLSIADERTKAIILLLASTGIRIGALPELKLKHFTPLQDCYDGLSKVSVYDGEYITFCTKEATEAIHNYMQYRERCGEKLGPNSPLIREQFNREDSLKARNPRPVTISTAEGLVTQTLIKTGLREIEHLTEGQSLGKTRKEIPLLHGFRKFFNTALMNSDVHPSFKKLLMGHSIQLDEVYYDKGSEKSRAKLLEEYSKAIDALTINEENRLKIKVRELEERDDAIMELKLEMDKLKRLMSTNNNNIMPKLKT